MRVILRENIENLGRTGDVVNVTDGYARNFLLPRNLVIAAGEGNVKALEHHKRSLEKKRQMQKATFEELAKKLNNVSCNIARKVGEGDKLFGSVTVADVAEALKKAGFEIEKHAIQLASPIKALGVHPVVIKLEPEVSATVKVWVVKEE